MLYARFFTLGLWATALAAPAPTTSYVAHERRELDVAHEDRFIKRARAPEAVMPVRIALKQRNLEYGHDLLMEISNPDSPRFGQHLSRQEIAKLFAPHNDSIAGVRTWLAESGIHPSRHSLSAGTNYIKFEAVTSEMEALLRTEYHIFMHAETGEEHIAADLYHIPQHLKEHVDFITPTVGYQPISKRENKRAPPESVGALPPPQKQRLTGALPQTAGGDLSNCYAVVTMDCIRSMYGIPQGTTSTKGNELGVFETLGEYDQDDLDMYYETYAKSVPAGTGPTIDSIDGGIGKTDNASEAEGEPLLDFELAIPLIYPQSTVLYNVDAIAAVEKPNVTGFGDTFLDALDKSFCTYLGGDNKTIDPHYPVPGPLGYNKTEQCGTYKPANVISISYGLAEFHFSRFYELRQCNEYMKLSLAGSSIIYASGDSGVASRQGCLGTPQKPSFAPGFPAACPYVTSVGATQLAFGQPVDAPQVAVNAPQFAFWSGGGFSNYWERPSYQDAAVSNYLKNHAPPYPAGTYNATGRGFPDVSAVGLNIFIYAQGSPLLEGGTSASAPIFASIITLINEKRLAAGKKSLGFLNQALYKNPAAFTDITSGSNPGCGLGGFNATLGWDPVTGLGTPKYKELEKALLALP